MDADNTNINKLDAESEGDPKQLYICFHCNQSFKLKCNLVSHIRTHTGEKPHVCEICDQSYSTKSGLALHFRTHKDITNRSKTRPAEIKKFICNYCEKGFSLKSNLILHIRTHTGEKPYRCTYCNKRSATKYNLLSHIRTHYSQKTIKCDYCDKYFSSRKNLHSHVQIHISTKRYYCSYCDKSSIHRGTLKVHERIHTGEKPYKCIYCGKMFNHRSNLTHHVRIHTGERPFICKYCNKGFRQKYALDGHERIHTGAKPYVCIECGKSFPYSASLRSHMKMHLGNQIFTCYHCMRSFDSKISLSLHIRVHMYGRVASSKRKANQDDALLLRSALALQPAMEALRNKNNPKGSQENNLNDTSDNNDSDLMDRIDLENPNVNNVLNMLLAPIEESELASECASNAPQHDFRNRLRDQLCKFMDKYSVKNMANLALRNHTKTQTDKSKYLNHNDLLSLINNRNTSNLIVPKGSVVVQMPVRDLSPEEKARIQFRARINSQMKTIVSNKSVKNGSDSNLRISKFSNSTTASPKLANSVADFQLKNHMNSQLKKLIHSNLAKKLDALSKTVQPKAEPCESVFIKVEVDNDFHNEIANTESNKDINEITEISPNKHAFPSNGNRENSLIEIDLTADDHDDQEINEPVTEINIKVENEEPDEFIVLS